MEECRIQSVIKRKRLFTEEEAEKDLTIGPPRTMMPGGGGSREMHGRELMNVGKLLG
ncbi:hypothetical protein LINGRAHAP2_LOCUS32967 [Linum grandiflorum]